VVQAGTTSKTFCPGTRLGWAAGPSEIVAQLVAAKQNTDQCASALGQRLYEEYARRGWIDEQLPTSRALYARRCARLLAALERTMPDGVTWTRPSGGFFSWLTVPADASALARRAVDEGVAIVPGPPFFPDGRGASNVRLSYSNVADELIDVGIERIAALVRAA
jgi:2-aminoadipate transaminase